MKKHASLLAAFLQFRGMNAIVTGATKGIGRAVLFALAEKGYNLAFCARNAGDLAATLADLQKQFPQARFWAQPTDMGKKSEVLHFAKHALDFLETVDVLVNNAGVFRPGRIQDEEEDAFEVQIQTNLASTYHLTRAILPDMILNKKGHIVNICSTASITAYTNGGSYCISKFGLLGFSKVLREECKEHSIGVTSVLPGATLTNSWAGTDLPENRFMKPEDVAKTIMLAIELGPNSIIEEILMRPMEGDIA